MIDLPFRRFVSGRYVGYFQAVVETRNATAGVAIDEILKEMERIRVNGVSDEELNEARLYLTGSFPLKMDTNAKIAGLLTDMEFYNPLPEDPIKFLRGILKGKPPMTKALLEDRKKEV
ncbi:MAG: hypothetical protein PHR77_08685 [Kiritimatiellae bacterium]|nr:hypothetical protein [Kiritimatiellia bacterium]